MTGFGLPLRAGITNNKTKTKIKTRGQQGYICKEMVKTREDKFTEENLLCVIQTLTNIPHPLKILESQMLLKISKSTLVTTNLSNFPKASKKALGYCSDSVSAEDQLSLKATGEL